MPKILLSLAKVRITIAVALTTITGYILAIGHLDTGIILPTLGVFLLACGSAALNQIQERNSDLKMERTRRRPLPSGDISLSWALVFTISLIIGGSLLLGFFANLTALLLGWTTLVWYNLIYTPLKKLTAFAVVPGSVIGALPPVIGWASAGAPITDPEILVVAFFFFLWQVPHFWLIMLKHGEEYHQAGFPSITKVFSESQIIRITLTWVLATAASSLMIAFFGVVESSVVKILIVIASLFLTWRFLEPLLVKSRPFTQRRAFITINLYSLAVMILLVADSYISH